MCTHRARINPYASDISQKEGPRLIAMTSIDDTSESHPDLINGLRQQIIGREAHIQTPYGCKPLVYCDHTASGRGLASIESIISREVLPHYANTHSEASHTGRHTGRLRQWARQTIKEVINAGPEDIVIFCGSGATAAVNTLVHLLGLRSASTGASTTDRRPLVLVGPYEHHSNELPWREAQADVIRLPLDQDGGIDQEVMTDTLIENADRHLIVGSFSAASNVTGIVSDVTGITRRLRDHGALAVWDYAAGAPYLAIDMNTADAPLDAIVFSPHKFIGGPGSSGVLAIKRGLLRNTVPAQIGGGTVRYVTPDRHEWHADPEHREEGGTPGIVESIRGAMAVSIPKRIGYQRIAEIENRHRTAAEQRFQATAGLEQLGPQYADQLPIFSLRFRSGQGELHYSYVVRLLNDLFGIQARGGCSCAGPYGHQLLGLTRHQSEALAAGVRRGFGCLRPGWVRFNLHWLCNDQEVDYILSAMALVAQWGAKLLASYTLDPESGLWQHRDAAETPPVSLDVFANNVSTLKPVTTEKPQQVLEAAEDILRSGAPRLHREQSVGHFQQTPWPVELESLCWFLRSHEGDHSSSFGS
jgi:selenocysteine lyase/cysteine desulfurase